MPDVAHLRNTLMLDYLSNLSLRGAGANDRVAGSFLSSFIRLSDKTVYEYGLARQHYSDWCSAPDNNTWSPLFRSIGHMENCITALVRVVRIAMKIKGNRSAPTLDKSARKGLRTAEIALVRIRNAIEHAEGDIPGQSEGTAHTLVLTNGEVELGPERVSYEVLVGWIVIVHDLAKQWTDYHPEDSM